MKRLIVGTINYYTAEPGWENVHLDASSRSLFDLADPGTTRYPDIVGDICYVKLPSDEYDEVRAHHVLEHIRPSRADAALRNIYWALKTGGVLDVEVPDIDRICAAWVSGSRDENLLLQWLFSQDLIGWQDDQLNHHLYGYTLPRLQLRLSKQGFRSGERVEGSDELALRLRVVK